jgi:hypothetical protein
MRATIEEIVALSGYAMLKFAESSEMHIGRWHVDIFPLGWFLIGMSVLVVLAIVGLLGWRVLRNSH